MKHFSTLTTALMLTGTMVFTGIVSAKGPADQVSWSRANVNNPSGSGDFLIPNCGGAFDGSDYVGQVPATATIASSSNNGQTTSEIEVRNARPNTHYTVWVRLKGASHGTGFGGAPITGGGATPYAPSSELGTLIADWVNPAGSLVPRANGFITDANGDADHTINADFYTGGGGAYPFNRMSAADLALAQSKRPAALATPTAIADKTDANMGGTPFLLRMVSHCLDNASHGVSPAKRETWFNIP